MKVNIFCLLISVLLSCVCMANDKLNSIKDCFAESRLVLLVCIIDAFKDDNGFRQEAVVAGNFKGGGELGAKITLKTFIDGPVDDALINDFVKNSPGKLKVLFCSGFHKDMDIQPGMLWDLDDVKDVVNIEFECQFKE